MKTEPQALPAKDRDKPALANKPKSEIVPANKPYNKTARTKAPKASAAPAKRQKLDTVATSNQYEEAVPARMQKEEAENALKDHASARQELSGVLTEVLKHIGIEPNKLIVDIRPTYPYTYEETIMGRLKEKQRQSLRYIFQECREDRWHCFINPKPKENGDPLKTAAATKAVKLLRARWQGSLVQYVEKRLEVSAMHTRPFWDTIHCKLCPELRNMIYEELVPKDPATVRVHLEGTNSYSLDLPLLQMRGPWLIPLGDGWVPVPFVFDRSWKVPAAMIWQKPLQILMGKEVSQEFILHYLRKCEIVGAGWVLGKFFRHSLLEQKFLKSIHLNKINILLHLRANHVRGSDRKFTGEVDFRFIAKETTKLKPQWLCKAKQIAITAMVDREPLIYAARKLSSATMLPVFGTLLAELESIWAGQLDQVQLTLAVRQAFGDIVRSSTLSLSNWRARIEDGE